MSRMKEGAGAESLLKWWRRAVLFFEECGRKRGSSLQHLTVDRIETFTLELDQLQASRDRIVLGAL